MNRPLAHILITRPEGQQRAMVESCQQMGLIVSHIPCLAIEPIDCAALNLDPAIKTDIVLFTSQNAVLHAHRQRTLPWPGVQVHAIGLATSRLLASVGQPVSLLPAPPFNSESYVSELETFAAQRLLIIKGEGGRSLIAEQLQKRHWSVTGLDVYRRVLPSVSDRLIDTTFNAPAPDIISIGSNETLLNLMTMASSRENDLLDIPLLVNSARCHDLALSLGFTRTPLVAVPAGDEGQLHTLKQWLATR